MLRNLGYIKMKYIKLPVIALMLSLSMASYAITIPVQMHKVGGGSTTTNGPRRVPTNGDSALQASFDEDLNQLCLLSARPGIVYTYSIYSEEGVCVVQNNGTFSNAGAGSINVESLLAGYYRIIISFESLSYEGWFCKEE